MEQQKNFEATGDNTQNESRIDFDKISIKNDIMFCTVFQNQEDGYQIRTGVKYDTLKESIVIFICDFDLFEKGSSVYTYRRIHQGIRGKSQGTSK